MAPSDRGKTAGMMPHSYGAVRQPWAINSQWLRPRSTQRTRHCSEVNALVAVPAFQRRSQLSRGPLRYRISGALTRATTASSPPARPVSRWAWSNQA